MTNHKTRDFLTSLPAAETWITPGWCRNQQPVDRGCMEAMGWSGFEELVKRNPEYVTFIGRKWVQSKSSNQNRPDPV